jgi:copper(I)-binding protein
MEYMIMTVDETTECHEWISAKEAHGDANGKVSSVKLTDLYTDFSLVDKQGNAKTQRKLSSEDIANGDRVLVVRIAGTSKKIASKEYKIKLKAADQFTNANVGTTSASAIQVELTKNYDKTAGLTLTNNSAQNVEFKVVGVKKESEITKWSTLKAKSGTKAGTAKVKTGEYISSEKIASGAAIIFRYPGVKGTTTVTLAGISYSYDLTGIKETEQKVTTATAKSGDKSTVTLDAEKQEVTVVVAKKDVATGSAVKLTVDLKLSGIKEAPKGTVTGYGTTDPKGTVKFNKDGTASFVIDVKKGFEAGKTITYTVKTTKGNAAFTVVFKYGLE